MTSQKLTQTIHAGWLGKSIGGTLGLPVEGRMERLGLTFYDPVPTVAPPNDDLELQLVWLDLAEKCGGELGREDFAKAWLENIHYMWDEYGRCRWNLRRGVPVDAVGTFENPFVDGMGSPIRSEIWACLFPGDADSAAHYAALDASLDHGVEGIAGEVFFSVMQSRILGGAGLNEAIESARGYIPKESETARAMDLVSECFAAGMEAWACRDELIVKHGNDNFTHAPLNVALTIWALLYGKSDFGDSILLAVNGGYDTDCTAATVGATLGFLLGREGIPERWVEPIGEAVFVGPGIQGIRAAESLGELTERCSALIGRLHARKWDGLIWHAKPPEVRLADLPGTIQIKCASGEVVCWANGEMPVEVKRAGGAEWIWSVTEAASRNVICLAQEGGRLFLDGELLVDCPSGVPYVPATHRCEPRACQTVEITPGAHVVRLELGSQSEKQNAGVLLAYPNQHLCPWTAEEIPLAARL